MHTRLRGRAPSCSLLHSHFWASGHRRPARSTPITAPAWCRRTPRTGPARHERVGRRDHPGREQDHRGRDVHVGEPGPGVRQHLRRPGPQPDLRLRRHHRRDRPGLQPEPQGAAHSLDTDGTSIYVGRSFASVGGDPSIKRLVKLTAAGSVASGFKAVPNAGVNEVVVRGSRVYVGGGFTSIRSRTVASPRGALAGLDSATGAVLAGVSVAFTGVYDPNNDGGGTTSILRFDVSPDGSRLAAVGNCDRRRPTACAARRARHQWRHGHPGPWATNRYDRAHNDCARVFDTFAGHRLLPGRVVLRGVGHRRVRGGAPRRRDDVRHEIRWETAARATTRPGRTTPAATRTASRSPAVPCTSAATCAG